MAQEAKKAPIASRRIFKAIAFVIGFSAALAALTSYKNGMTTPEGLWLFLKCMALMFGVIAAGTIIGIAVAFIRARAKASL